MFLADLLPSEGYICVAMLLPGGGFRHFFYDALPAAQGQITALNDLGHTVYVAQATFKTTESRKQTNAHQLKNFFFDIDCGEGKPYQDQAVAVKEFKEFLTETNLPFPSVVSSGNGLYAHWILEEAIDAEKWRTVARILKATAAAYGFKDDPSRTSDSSSVLRPVGATNRKNPNNPKPVQLLKYSQPVSFLEFVQALDKAAKKKKVNTEAVHPPKTTDINSDFMAGLDNHVPCSIVLVANKCAQLRAFRDTKGDVSEPLWYAALGVMVHCENGPKYIQDWSSGHQDYAENVTRAKAQQYLDSGAGPSTCAKFGQENPEGCIGCPHANKIKSPIVLGRPEPKPLEVTEKNMEPAAGFRRSEDGLFFDDDGRWTRFYDQDLYIDRITYDMSLGYQMAVIKHKLPYEGTMEFMIRSSLIHDPRALMVALSDNNVHVVGVKEKKIMVAYIEGHLAKLQRLQRMTRLLSQMGWSKSSDGKTLFVLGRKMFYEDGTIEEASLAKNVPAAAQGFRSEGDLNKWTKSTELLNQPGMEPFAFALLCGFAAPLLKFTGFEGALVSLVGESGAGKTLMLRMMLSIYGYHKDLMVLRDDTRNMLVSRLGTYGNLPLAVDEVTNIDGQELSDLVYRITQGRDKGRLKQNAEERTQNTWNTLAVVSSNSALTDKLSSAKFDSSAELNRVFEYRVNPLATFSGDVTAQLFWTLDTNFGHAGERFIHWLVQNYETAGQSIKKLHKKISVDISIQSEERFWAAIVSSAIYAGLVAQKLDLIKFDVARVLAWAEKQIVEMRNSKADMSEDSVGILAQFIDAHSANRLVVRGSGMKKGDCMVIEAPRGSLVMRHELDTDRLFIARNSLSMWVTKRYGSYTKIKEDLRYSRALVSSTKKKALGAGTQFAGAQLPCWEIDLKNPALGSVGLQLMVKAQTMEARFGAKEGGV